MEKDNKILLGAVLIMLVAMVSFNFNSITGKATTSSGVLVSAAPSELYFSYDDLANKPSKVVKVKVEVDSQGIENQLDLYRSNGERIGGQGRELCRSSNNCRKGVYTVDFRIPSSLQEGSYFFRVQRRDFAGRSREVFNSNQITVTKYSKNYPNYQG